MDRHRKKYARDWENNAMNRLRKTICGEETIYCCCQVSLVRGFSKLDERLAKATSPTKADSGRESDSHAYSEPLYQ